MSSRVCGSTSGQPIATLDTIQFTKATHGYAVQHRASVAAGPGRYGSFRGTTLRTGVPSGEVLEFGPIDFTGSHAGLMHQLRYRQHSDRHQQHDSDGHASRDADPD